MWLSGLRHQSFRRREFEFHRCQDILVSQLKKVTFASREKPVEILFSPIALQLSAPVEIGNSVARTNFELDHLTHSVFRRVVSLGDSALNVHVVFNSPFLPLPHLSLARSRVRTYVPWSIRKPRFHFVRPDGPNFKQTLPHADFLRTTNLLGAGKLMSAPHGRHALADRDSTYERPVSYSAIFLRDSIWTHFTEPPATGGLHASFLRGRNPGRNHQKSHLSRISYRHVLQISRP